MGVNVEREGGFEIAVHLGEVAEERSGRRQDGNDPTVHCAQPRAMEIIDEASGNTSIDRLRRYLVCSRGLDVQLTVDARCVCFASDATRDDASIERAQIERDSRRNAQ